MHALQWRSKRCWTMSSHQWALTDVRPVCCLADFAILNLLIASLFFLLLYLVMLRSVGQAPSPLLALSMQGLVGEWEPQHKKSTQVPTRNVSENDLSLVWCNLNRKKVNCTDNIRRPTSRARKERDSRKQRERAMTSAV